MTAEEEVKALRQLVEGELERRRERNRKFLVVAVFTILVSAIALPIYFTNRAEGKRERQEEAQRKEEFIRQRQEHIKTGKLTEELRGMPLSQFDELMRETEEVLQRTPSLSGAELIREREEWDRIVAEEWNKAQRIIRAAERLQ